MEAVGSNSGIVRFVMLYSTRTPLYCPYLSPGIVAVVQRDSSSRRPQCQYSFPFNLLAFPEQRSFLLYMSHATLIHAEQSVLHSAQ